MAEATAGMDLRLRAARARDVAPLLALINDYADRRLLLRRSDESLRARLTDFAVAEQGGEIVGCGALSELGPGIGEVRSLAVRAGQTGRGVGHALVEHLLHQAGGRGFAQVLALTRRVSFFAALGFEVTDRRRFEDKLRTDCQSCPLNVCCDETAMVRPPLVRAAPVPRRAHDGTRPRQRRVGRAGVPASIPLVVSASGPLAQGPAIASPRAPGGEAHAAAPHGASPALSNGVFLFEDNP